MRIFALGDSDNFEGITSHVLIFAHTWIVLVRDFRAVAVYVAWDWLVIVVGVIDVINEHMSIEWLGWLPDLWVESLSLQVPEREGVLHIRKTQLIAKWDWTNVIAEDVKIVIEGVELTGAYWLVRVTGRWITWNLSSTVGALLCLVVHTNERLH